MTGLDTNVLIRWLAADDGQSDQSTAQVAAVERAVLGAKDGCYVNAVVLAETIWVVANLFKQPRAMQSEIIQRLLLAHNVRVGDESAVKSALDVFENGPSSGGFADLLIGALNAAAGCTTTITFDKRAARATTFTLLT
ncbi:MAG: type II toxin-antitoxin system VapC family toxin [Pseudomonadota bacterium]